MLSNVLNSSKAINVSIEIIRIFDRLRQYTLSQSTTDSRIDDLRKILMLHIENTDNKFSEQDKTINQIIQALNNLIEQPPKKTRQIGFIQYDDVRLIFVVNFVNWKKNVNFVVLLKIKWKEKNEYSWCNK